jgi:hypothetical protein
MAFTGPISYMEIEGGTTDWEKEDLVSPWDKGSSGNGPGYSQDPNALLLEARARDFQIKKDGLSWNEVLDIPGKQEADRGWFKCVLVGRESILLAGDSRGDERIHYVLIVKPSETGESSGSTRVKLYERVGIAALPGKWIDLEGDWLDIKIQ